MVSTAINIQYLSKCLRDYYIVYIISKKISFPSSDWIKFCVIYNLLSVHKKRKFRNSSQIPRADTAHNLFTTPRNFNVPLETISTRPRGRVFQPRNRAQLPRSQRFHP